MKELVIREAKRSESSLILAFIEELALYERLSDKVFATAESIEKAIFDQKYANVVFLTVDSIEVGFALYFYTFSTFEGKATLYLEDLFVKEEYRGLGYGKQLFKALGNIALKNDCARFEWSCLDWNQKAIDFYLSLGAIPQKEWTIYRLEKSGISQLTK